MHGEKTRWELQKNATSYFVTHQFTQPLDIWLSQVGDQILAESVVCPHCEFLDPDNWIQCLSWNNQTSWSFDNKK